MKIFWTLFTSLILTVGLVSTADAGKRFGSGSFGKAFQTTPYKKTTPQQAPQKQQPAQAAPAGKSKGLMGGMLGGLLAGGLFAYLLGSGAFEGLQLMDILLIAGLIFIVMKLLRGRAQPQTQVREAWAGNMPGHTPDPASAHHFDGGADSQQQPMNLPDGFDAQAFTDGALQHFRDVQNAWNNGDLSVIAEYVSPELYAALARQRQSMMVPPQTEILDLNAEIVRADHSDVLAEVSVLFRGRVKDELEKSEDGVFDVWHLERDLSKDGAPWLIVGIEAE